MFLFVCVFVSCQCEWYGCELIFSSMMFLNLCVRKVHSTRWKNTARCSFEIFVFRFRADLSRQCWLCSVRPGTERQALHSSPENWETCKIFTLFVCLCAKHATFWVVFGYNYWCAPVLQPTFHTPPLSITNGVHFTFHVARLFEKGHLQTRQQFRPNEWSLIEKFSPSYFNHRHQPLETVKLTRHRQNGREREEKRKSQGTTPRMTITRNNNNNAKDAHTHTATTAHIRTASFDVRYNSNNNLNIACCRWKRK